SAATGTDVITSSATSSRPIQDRKLSISIDIFSVPAIWSPSQLHIGKIADSVAVGLVGIAENRNVDEMGGSPIWPNEAIDLPEVDLLASPLPNVLVAAVGHIMGKPSDIFVVPSFELIAPDDLHPAVLPGGRPENQEQPGGMVVALARALVERALDRFLDVPAPNQELIIGQVQIEVTEQHRGSRPGLEAQGRHAFLDGEGRLHWPARPERAVIPTRREWIERERRREIHHCHFRLTITGDHVGPL